MVDSSKGLMTGSRARDNEALKAPSMNNSLCTAETISCQNLIGYVGALPLAMSSGRSAELFSHTNSIERFGL